MKTKLSCVLALMFLTAMFANATSVTFNSLPQYTADGYYVGYSGATVDGQALNLLCDDFSHTTNIPSGPFTYNVETLNNLTGARFGTVNTRLVLYETAAILLWNFDSILNPTTSQAEIYQFAIWDLMTPSTPAIPSQAAVQALITGAQATVASGGITSAYNKLRILTPIGASDTNQEMLALTSNTYGSSTPEPTSFAMIGIGLVVLGMRRRS